MAQAQDKKKQQPGAPPTECKYEVGYEARQLKMVMRCKECGGRSSLKDEVCLGAVINALSRETGVDSIILAHFIETQYYEKSIELLKMLVSIANELTQLAGRDPIADAVGAGMQVTSDQKRMCERCSLAPPYVFDQLRGVFIYDLVAFYEMLVGKVQEAGNAQGAGGICGQCVSTTMGDFSYIYEKFEELVKYIVKEGFQIVL
ncbi:MAG: hypothetical protein QW728_06960 [Thermoplasmata archaeon]